MDLFEPFKPMSTAEHRRTTGGDGLMRRLFQRTGDELTPWIDGEWKRTAT